MAVALRLADAPADSAADAAAMSTVELDAAAGRALVADVSVSARSAYAGVRQLGWHALAIGAAGFGVAALLMTLALGRLVRNQLETPLAALRDGFRRAMDGDYTEPVVAAPDTPYAPMIRRPCWQRRPSSDAGLTGCIT